MTDKTTGKEEVQHWDAVLDEYENGIGLPKYSEQLLPVDELNEYLSMDRTLLEKLTPQDCAEISYRLSQYAFHVQRTLNRELARFNWAEERIKEIIADEINNYKGYGYLEKSTQAIKHNSKAQSINNVKKYAKQRADRLSFIASNLKNLADILISVQKNKVKNNG